MRMKGGGRDRLAPHDPAVIAERSERAVRISYRASLPSIRGLLKVSSILHFAPPSRPILNSFLKASSLSFLLSVFFPFQQSCAMGWLPWSSDSSSNAASDGGRIAPDRSSRQRCYEGRDLFFSCLDRNDILDAVKNDKEAQRKCGKELAQFETVCSRAWVRCA